MFSQKIFTLVKLQIVFGFFCMHNLFASHMNDRLKMICSSQLRAIVEEAKKDVNLIDQSVKFNPHAVSPMVYDKIRNKVIIALENKKSNEITCDNWKYACVDIPVSIGWSIVTGGSHKAINESSRYYCVKTINYAQDLLDEGVVKK